MSSESELDVFISYNKADYEMAKKIREHLTSQKIGERQIHVFFAPRSIKPGYNFISLIDDGLAKARFFVLVLSPEALQAEWPTAERAASLLSDPSGRVGRVIPTLVKSCKIPPLLAIRSWIDLREKSKFKTEMQKMLCMIKGEPLPESVTPSGTRRVVESNPSTLIMENKAHEPDQIGEYIHTNLFPITKLPHRIWKAFTILKEENLYKLLGNKSPQFILKESHLYTFSNLTEECNSLRSFVDTKTIIAVNIETWLNNEDKSRWLIHLLGRETRQFCKNHGLYFDKTGKQFYGDMKEITGKKISWMPHVRKAERGLIIPYEKKDKDTGKMTKWFYRHRAVNLRFQIIGNELFLRIEPGWEFSLDGSILIKGKRRSKLSTRLQSCIRNSAEFDEMRFWAWLLSDGSKITMGSSDSTIEINLKPLRFKTDYGVHGDHKPIPDAVEKPPSLVEEEGDDSEIVITDEELDEDVKRVEYNDV